MKEPRLTVRLDNDHQGYRPGERITGLYDLTLEGEAAAEALEVSILWYTEGKGNEDLGVHHFERQGAGSGEVIRGGRFEVQLPPGPLSYEGVLVKVRWCIRVRAFLMGGRELVTEAPFRLGQTQ